MTERRNQPHPFAVFPALRTLTACFCTLIFSLLVAVLLLTLAFSIPNDAIAENAAASVFEIDARWDALKAAGSALTPGQWLVSGVDYYNERLWIEMATVEDETAPPLVRAMCMNGYARYWHGYQSLLRPLLTVFSYNTILYATMALFLLLLAACSGIIAKRLGVLPLLLFLGSFLFIRVSNVLFCLNFSTAFLIGMGALLAADALFGTRREWLLCPLFLLAGAATSYFELLITPLVSLGMPLVYLLARRLRDAAPTLSAGLRESVCLSASWGAGWAGLWSMKWLVGTQVLGWNVLSDAVDAASFRIGGDAAATSSPLRALSLCFGQLFFHRWALMLLVLAAFLLAVVLFGKRDGTRLRALPLAAVSLYPAAWMCVLANHCEVHYYFVYRILFVLLFGAGLYAWTCLDMPKIKRLRRRRA